MSTVKAILVGDEPTGPSRTPFRHAKCAARLLEWVDYLIDEDDYVIVNQSDYTYLEFSELCIKYNLPPVVFLGTKAKKKFVHGFLLPHPSGLNRQLNDKAKLWLALRRCKAYLDR